MRRYTFILPALALGAALLAGCTQLPPLDGTISDVVRDEPYVPFIELGAETAPTPSEDLENLDPLEARAAALSRRADAARGQSVVSPDLQSRVDARLQQ